MFYKIFKKCPHFRRSAEHAFRMPLDTDTKRIIFQFDRFNRFVTGTGSDYDAFSGEIDSLMVETVDIEKFRDISVNVLSCRYGFYD